ncbi:MAG: lysine--tRNA ligase, partial [Treponema sp.]|nr:lysine--tRNA ligase [Treponema sp.]
VIKTYEDYDKTERIAWKMEAPKDEAAYRREKRIYELSQPAVSPEGKTLMPPVKPYQAPFRHLCNLIQIADGNIEKAIASLRNTLEGPSEEQIPALRARAACAKYWVEQCAPEEFRFKLKESGAAVSGLLSDAEKTAVRNLRDKVIANIETWADDKSCAEALYKTAGDSGLEGKALFRAAYQALIGKDQGPRLANFLRSISKERLMGILAVY